MDSLGQLYMCKGDVERRVPSFWQRKRLIDEALVNLGLPNGASVC